MSGKRASIPIDEPLNGSQEETAETTAESRLKLKFFIVASYIGALTLLACIVGGSGSLPWRQAAAPIGREGQFNVSRNMGPFTLSNQYGQATSWFTMSRLVCDRSAFYETQDEVTQSIGEGAEFVATKSSGHLPKGGAGLGCQWWPECKAHVKARCEAYKSIGGLGIVAFISILIGILSALLVHFMLNAERYVKSKDKLHAKRNTALASMFAFGFPCVGVCLWVFSTERHFKELQTTGAYPYPAVGPGINAACFALGLLGLAMAIGIGRQEVRMPRIPKFGKSGTTENA